MSSAESPEVPETPPRRFNLDFNRNRAKKAAHPYKAKELNYTEIRTEIMALLSEKTQQTTAEFLAAFRSKYTEDRIRKALHYLEDDGYISRQSYQKPWRFGKS